MPHDKRIWALACELARSGDYANIVMVERELVGRGILRAGESVTTHALKRELLTRICHAARTGEAGGGTSTSVRLRHSLGLSYAWPSAEEGSAPAR